MNPDLMAVYASLGQGRVKLHAALREAADAYPDDLVLAGRIREIEDYRGGTVKLDEGAA